MKDKHLQEVMNKATKYIREQGMGYIEAIQKAEKEVLEEKLGAKYGLCPECGAKMIPDSGCSYCPFCGWSECK